MKMAEEITFSKENIDQAFAYINRFIATDDTIFNKGNAQAAVHAVTLMYDKIIGGTDDA